MSPTRSRFFASGSIGLVAMLAVLALPTTADDRAAATRAMSGKAPEDRISVQPDWDREAIRECAYSIVDLDLFNLIYACYCLREGAETEGEEESAEAQCEQAMNHVFAGPRP